MPAEALHISHLYWLHQTNLFSCHWQHVHSWIKRLDHWMGNHQQRRWWEPLLFSLAAVETGRWGQGWQQLQILPQIKVPSLSITLTEENPPVNVNKRLLFHSKHALLWKFYFPWAPFCDKQQKNFKQLSWSELSWIVQSPSRNHNIPDPALLFCQVSLHIRVNPHRLLLPKPDIWKSVILPLILLLVSSSSSWWLMAHNLFFRYLTLLWRLFFFKKHLELQFDVSVT